MDNAVLFSVKSKYKPTMKGAGIEGILMMKSDGFIWHPKDQHAAVKLDIGFNSIKSYRWSKETPNASNALLKFGTSPDPAADGGYIFVFSSFQDRDKCKDIYSTFQGKSQQISKPAQSTTPAKRSSSGAPKVAPKGVQLDLKEFEKRQQLLQNDNNLRRLHQELVMGNILTEEEFWATRKELLEGEDKKKKQKTGIASALMADVRPVTDGQTNTVTFSLTPEIIAQIFAEKPAVLRSFLDFVPSKMSEKEFWTKYCRAEYLLATHKSAEAFAEAADDEDLVMFVREDTQLNEEAKKKVLSVDPTVDMAADDADDYSHAVGHGFFQSATKVAVFSEKKTTKGKKTLIKDINRHAEVVLQGRLFDSDVADAKAVALSLAQKKKEAEIKHSQVDEINRKIQVEKAVEMDDLQGPKEPDYVPLNIQDPKNYFHQQITEKEKQKFYEKLASVDFEVFRKKIKEIKEGKLRDFVPDGNACVKVFTTLNQKLVQARENKSSSTEKPTAFSLPDSLQSQVLGFAEAVKELLRHFWASYPITNQSLLDKATRHKAGIEAFYDKLEKFRGSCPQDHRHALFQIMRPIFQSLDAAIEHFRNDSKKRAMRANRSSGKS